MTDTQRADLSWIRTTYEERGFVRIPNVLDADLIREMGQHVEWLAARNPGTRPEMLGHTLIPDDPFWCRVVSDDRLLDIAEQFIGPNIALFASSYFSKPPFDGMPVLWHQDGNYWPLEPQDAVVSLWIAVDDSTPENGCMRVIPATQELEFKDHLPAEKTRNVLLSQLPPEAVDESKAVDVILNAGDVSIHGPRIIHGSNANASPKRRCGLTVRYIPTTTRIVPGIRGWPNERWPSAFLLRGEAIAGVNDYCDMPRFDPGRHMPFAGSGLWFPRERGSRQLPEI